MKASEGTGAAVGLPVPASVPRPWKTSPLTEGRMLGRKHGVVQPGEPKVLTSVSCCEGPSGRLRGPWDRTGLPKHTEKADGDVAAVSGGTRDHGWKGKPPCGSCVHQHPAGLRSAHGLRSSPYSVHFMGCKTVWGSVLSRQHGPTCPRLNPRQSREHSGVGAPYTDTPCLLP